MSIRKRELPSGFSVFEVRWTEFGKKKSKSFSRKADADEFEHQVARIKEQRALHEGWNQRFEEAARSWESHQDQQELSNASRLRFKQVLQGWVLPEFASKLLSEIRPTDLEPWVKRMRSHNLAASSINKIVQIFKAVLNYEVRMGRIPYNPVAGFKLLRVPQREFLVWNKREAQDFLAHMQAKYRERHAWVHTVYLLALNTGLRAGEIWGLRWSDVLWSDQLIKVEQTCDAITRSLKIGTKGRRSRFVPLTKPIADGLRELQELADSSPLVFHTGGRPINHDNFRRDHWEKDVREASENLGLRAIRFHDLRHAAATLMLREGLAPGEVQQILGHSSLTTTMRYVHLLGSQSALKAAQIFGVASESSVSA